MQKSTLKIELWSFLSSVNIKLARCEVLIDGSLLLYQKKAWKR
jgi:hypothetical protein